MFWILSTFLQHSKCQFNILQDPINPRFNFNMEDNKHLLLNCPAVTPKIDTHTHTHDHCTSCSVVPPTGCTWFPEHCGNPTDGNLGQEDKAK